MGIARPWPLCFLLIGLLVEGGIVREGLAGDCRVETVLNDWMVTKNASALWGLSWCMLQQESFVVSFQSGGRSSQRWKLASLLLDLYQPVSERCSAPHQPPRVLSRAMRRAMSSDDDVIGAFLLQFQKLAGLGPLHGLFVLDPPAPGCAVPGQLYETIRSVLASYQALGLGRCAEGVSAWFRGETSVCVDPTLCLASHRSTREPRSTIVQELLRFRSLSSWMAHLIQSGQEGMVGEYGVTASMRRSLDAPGLGVGLGLTTATVVDSAVHGILGKAEEVLRDWESPDLEVRLGPSSVLVLGRGWHGRDLEAVLRLKEEQWPAVVVLPFAEQVDVGAALARAPINWGRLILPLGQWSAVAMLFPRVDSGSSALQVAISDAQNAAEHMMEDSVWWSVLLGGSSPPTLLAPWIAPFHQCSTCTSLKQPSVTHTRGMIASLATFLVSRAAATVFCKDLPQLRHNAPVWEIAPPDIVPHTRCTETPSPFTASTSLLGVLPRCSVRVVQGSIERATPAPLLLLSWPFPEHWQLTAELIHRYRGAVRTTWVHEPAFVSPRYSYWALMYSPRPDTFPPPVLSTLVAALCGSGCARAVYPTTFLTQWPDLEEERLAMQAGLSGAADGLAGRDDWLLELAQRDGTALLTDSDAWWAKGYALGGARTRFKLRRNGFLSIMKSSKLFAPGHGVRSWLSLRLLQQSHRDVRVLGSGDAHASLWAVDDAFSDFEASIVVENDRSLGWWTEKLLSALAWQCVPVYFGSPTVAVEDSLIRVPGHRAHWFFATCGVSLGQHGSPRCW
jgi:hypothetical protein